MFIKQSTAYTFRFGPFLDETDGKTAETGLTISQADVRLSKGGGNFAQKNESSSSSHDEIGYYIVVLDTTDTNTCGELLVACHESGALPVFKTFQVLEEAIYDALFAASASAFDANARVDVVSIEGSDATDQINAACDAAIVTYGLDHLVSASVAGSDVVDNSIVAKLVSKESTADWDDFANTTDSLQALRDQTGSGLTAIPWNSSWDAEVQSECNDALVGMTSLIRRTVYRHREIIRAPVTQQFHGTQAGIRKFKASVPMLSMLTIHRLKLRWMPCGRQHRQRATPVIMPQQHLHSCCT